MTPTRLRTLFAAAALTALATWLLARVAYQHFPVLPRSTAATVGILAVVVGYTAYSTRARLLGRPRTKPILPITVARYAALAKASSLAGALMAGAWAGLLGYTAQHLAQRAASVDTITAALGLGASVALVGAALRLERVCRVPPPPQPPPDE